MSEDKTKPTDDPKHHYTGLVVRQNIMLYDEVFDAYIVGYDHTGQIISAASEITMKRYTPGNQINSHGVITFPKTDAKKIMDELWNVGIRPSGYLEPRGQIQAMQNHIEDLRVVAKITGRPT